MKKIICMAMALIFTIMVYAYEKNRYVVTSEVVYKYVYYVNGQEIGREYALTKTYTFTVCAWGTGDAIRETVKMVDRNFKKYIGTDYYNGKTCSKYIKYGYIGKSTAEKQGTCCE